jgi:protein-S-isoprenylcysteine O-methyltransferase Ste14
VTAQQQVTALRASTGKGASAGPTTRQIDLGRVAVVVLFTLTFGSNAVTLSRHVSGTDALWQKASEVASSLLALCFCALVVRAYLRRGPATATDHGVLVWLAAPLATVVPLAMAAVPPRTQGPLATGVQLGLTLAGLSFSVWAVRSLATNLSIVPQARGTVAHGPYRLVRHPLYLGELVALTGLTVHAGRAAAFAVLGLEVVLQLYRAGREERLLTSEVAGYADYARRTRRLIPGVW